LHEGNREASAVQGRAREIGALQVRVTQIGTGEDRTFEIRALQVSVLEIYMAKVGTLTVRLGGDRASIDDPRIRPFFRVYDDRVVLRRGLNRNGFRRAGSAYDRKQLQEALWQALGHERSLRKKK
jgi:hypothetical protein